MVKKVHFKNDINNINVKKIIGKISKVIVSIIYIILLTVSYKYINTLKNKCDCESKILKDNNIKLLKKAILFHIIYIVLYNIILSNIKSLQTNIIYNILIILISLFILSYIIYVLYFHYKLNKECKCNDIDRTNRITMLSFYIFLASILCIFILFGLIRLIHK